MIEVLVVDRVLVVDIGVLEEVDAVLAGDEGVFEAEVDKDLENDKDCAEVLFGLVVLGDGFTVLLDDVLTLDLVVDVNDFDSVVGDIVVEEMTIKKVYLYLGGM